MKNKKNKKNMMSPSPQNRVSDINAEDVRVNHPVNYIKRNILEAGSPAIRKRAGSS